MKNHFTSPARFALLAAGLACAPLSAGACIDDEGPDETAGLSDEEPEYDPRMLALCNASGGRNNRCGPTSDPATNEDVEACAARLDPCFHQLYRPGVAEGLTGCLESASCDESVEPECGERVAMTLPTTATGQMYFEACSAFYAEAANAACATDDAKRSCATPHSAFNLLTDDVLAALAPCYEGTCESITQCVLDGLAEAAPGCTVTATAGN